MSILKNFNYMKGLFRHPCASPSPQIAIQTAFQAAAPLLLVPFTFSCTDWVKSSVGISWKCGRKLKSVAKHVYGARFTDGVHFMYSASGAAALENALWIWFVADLAVNFAADWMTLMYIEQGCDLTRNGCIQGGLGSLYLDGGSSGILFLDTRDEKPCVEVGGNEIQFPGGCEGTVSYEAQWEAFGNDPANQGTVTSYLLADDGTILSESECAPPHSGRQQWTGGSLNHLKGRFIAGTSYRIGFRVNKGLMRCKGGSFTASGFGKPMPLIPAGCFSNLGAKLGL